MHACAVLKGTTCSLPLSSGMPSLPLSCSGLSSSAMTPWMRKGEESDPNCHVHNRYGIQLGTKVPLWGRIHWRGEFHPQVVDAQA